MSEEEGKQCREHVRGMGGSGHAICRFNEGLRIIELCFSVCTKNTRNAGKMPKQGSRTAKKSNISTCLILKIFASPQNGSF